jgi:hypothetical protein
MGIGDLMTVAAAERRKLLAAVVQVAAGLCRNCCDPSRRGLPDVRRQMRRFLGRQPEVRHPRPAIAGVRLSQESVETLRRVLGGGEVERRAVIFVGSARGAEVVADDAAEVFPQQLAG